MKLEALDHPKTLDFASRLGIKRPQAIGHLELLWAFVAKKTPQGDIGKWPDGVIASSCFWEGKAEDFIQALVDSGYLDRHSTHRLIVHDWAEHAQSWVRMKLRKAGQDFITAEPIAMVTAIDTTDPPTEASAEAIAMVSTEPITEATTRARVPSQAKPSQAKPSLFASAPRSALQSPPDPEDQAGYERDIRESYPPCNGAQRWIEALRSCRQQVEDGDATWQELLARTREYREFVNAGGVSGPAHVLTPQNFFAAADKLWRQHREPPKSRAEKRLAGNLTAAQEFMRRTEPTA